jgi:hypothetical protein
MPTAVTFHARLRSSPAQNYHGIERISDVLPFGRLWYGEPICSARISIAD